MCILQVCISATKKKNQTASTSTMREYAAANATVNVNHNNQIYNKAFWCFHAALS